MGELAFEFKQDRLTRYNLAQQMLYWRVSSQIRDAVG